MTFVRAKSKVKIYFKEIVPCDLGEVIEYYVS